MTVHIGEDKVEVRGLAPRLVNAEDGARALGIGRSGVYLLMQRGELRSVKIGSRRLIAVADLDAFVSRLEAEG